MSLAEQTKPANFFTCGDWLDEASSCAAFDRLIDDSHLFHVEENAHGFYVQPKVHQKRENAFIDRILIPQRRLVEKGWGRGCIGVECKRSNYKLGPVLAQTLDYKRAIFDLKYNGSMVMLDQCFIWPLKNPRGCMEAVMTQHRIGGVYLTANGRLLFWLGGTHVIAIEPDGTFSVKDLSCGEKAGTR